MTDKPKQKCKHCGTVVEGQPVSGGSPMSGNLRLGPSIPLHYRFNCNGPGNHGADGEDREWFWTVLDPRDEALKEHGR